MDVLHVLITTVVILSLIVVVQFVSRCRDAFKIAYYETTLENNRYLFSEERYAGVERVKSNPWLFLK